MGYRDQFLKWKQEYIAKNNPVKSDSWSNLQRAKLLEFKNLEEANNESKTSYLDEPIPDNQRGVLADFKRMIQKSPTLKSGVSKVFPGYSKTGVVTSGDVIGAPGRTYYQATQGIGEQFGVGDPTGRGGTLGESGTIEGIVGDPVLPLSLIGGQFLPAASKGVSALDKAIKYGKVGAIEQAPLSLYAQHEKMAQGGELSIPEVVGETALGAATGPLGPMANKAIKSAGQVAKKALSQLSGKSVDLLETVGAKELKEGFRKFTDLKGDFKPDVNLEKIRNYSEKAEEITSDVIGYMDGFEDLYKNENVVINDALKAMGDVDLSGTIQELNKLKLKALPIDLAKKLDNVPVGYTTGVKATDDFLTNVDNVIEEIGGGASGVSTFVRPAEEALKIRRRIDDVINFNKSNYSTEYARKLDDIAKKARTSIKNKLEESAINTGNKQYINAMNEFSRLLNVRDRIFKKITGKDGSKDKVRSFLVSLGNPDKLENKILADDVKKILGKDLFEEARILRLAKEYKDGLSVFTDIQTGKSNYLQSGLEGAQKAGAMLLGSPKFGSAPLTAGIDFASENLEKYSPLMRSLKASTIEEQ